MCFLLCTLQLFNDVVVAAAADRDPFEEGEFCLVTLHTNQRDCCFLAEVCCCYRERQLTAGLIPELPSTPGECRHAFSSRSHTTAIVSFPPVRNVRLLLMGGDVETNPGPGSSSSESTVETFDDLFLSFLVGDSDFELEDELEYLEPRQPKQMRFAIFAMPASLYASLYFVQEDGADHRQSSNRPDWVRLHACTASLSDAFSLSRAGAT